MDDKAMVTDLTGNGRASGGHNYRLAPSSPVADQSLVNVSVERRNHHGGSDRKRNRRAMADDGALDDIMGQITSKLTTLSTKETFTEEDSIGAFIDVLNCSRSEAQFYLESSAWNVETAVMLWLENNPNTHSSSYLTSLAVPTHAYYTGSGLGGMGPYFDAAMGGPSSGMPGFNRPKGTPMFRPREVVIEGLPAGWSARVSKHSGQVYFVDQSTGKTQYSVPTGYADRDTDGVVELSHSANSHDEEGMADDLDGSMEQDAPDSPVAGPPNSIDPRNSRPVAHRSGVKSDGTYNNSTRDSIGGAFRSAMDDYQAYSDASVASDASSNKAVWDDGSGYSLNDGTYSVSSTTNSTTDNSPVFGSMRGGHAGGGTGSLTSTFLSGNNSMLTTASSTSDALNPNTALPQHDTNQNNHSNHNNHSNMQYFGHHSIYGNQGNHTVNCHQNNHNGAHEGPMTQDPTPTPLDAPLYPQASAGNGNGNSSHSGGSRPSSGIAMLGPASEADHSNDYFLGAFTPASSQHSSTNDLS